MKQIKTIVDQGQYEEALAALDDLLAIGPGNTEALKMQADILTLEGRLLDAEKVWEKIALVDNEDEDAVNFLLRKRVEDREHFFFSELLPEGGRTFFAFPRRLLYTSATGFLACLSFLILARLSYIYPVLSTTAVLFGSFGLLVIWPWVAIIKAYFQDMVSFTVSPQGVTVRSRIKKWHIDSENVEGVYLAHRGSTEHPELFLVLNPKDAGSSTIAVNLTLGSSSLRARTHLLKEFLKHKYELKYSAFETFLARSSKSAPDHSRLLLF